MTMKQAQKQRSQRTRKSLHGTKHRPRVSVFRSNKGIYIQVINDDEGKTLFGISSRAIKNDTAKTRMEQAKELGMRVAKGCSEHNIKQVVFDRGAYAYHGIVKQVAEGAREAGIVF